METLKQLEKKLRVVDIERAALRDMIEELKDAEALPELRKTYEGKYFKYNNGTSPKERWFIYVYCVKIVDRKSALVNLFESSPYENKFKHNVEEYLHLFETEIPEKEYRSQLKKFESKLKRLTYERQ